MVAFARFCRKTACILVAARWTTLSSADSEASKASLINLCARYMQVVWCVHIYICSISTSISMRVRMRITIQFRSQQEYGAAQCLNTMRMKEEQEQEWGSEPGAVGTMGPAAAY